MMSREPLSSSSRSIDTPSARLTKTAGRFRDPMVGKGGTEALIKVQAEESS